MIAALLLLRTDKDFYFQSQTVLKLYIYYFSYTGLYIYARIGIFSCYLYKSAKKYIIREDKKMTEKRELI